MKSNGHNGHRPKFDHLDRAMKAIVRAREEFTVAKKNRDELDVAQAAEKAWLAVSEATKALLRHRGFTERQLPDGQRGEFALLKRHGGSELAKLFITVHSILHGDVFYRGLVEWDLTGTTIGQAETYVAKVRQIAERGK